MIQFLGNHNLFVSHFIMGCKEAIKDFTKTETDEIRVLSKWLFYKDNDPFMRKYRTNRTQYVDFLTIIEPAVLKEIIDDLKRIYLIEFPFSEKEDFIESVFGHSLYKLETFIENNMVCYGSVLTGEPFDFYNYYDNPFSEFLDYVTEESRTIEYYKQYYKWVINLIEEVEYPSSNSKSSKKRIRESKEIADKLKGESVSIQKPSKKELELSELITHQKSQELANQISIQYKNIKGKQLKLLLISLKELGLFPNERMDRKFHTACNIFFDWDIASYEAMRSYKYNENVDKEECDLIKDFLTNIINGNGSK